VPEDFLIYLKRLIDDRFKSRRAFVRAAEPEGNEDSLVSQLSKVLEGKRPPPLNRIEAWADALGLTGADKESLINRATLENLHPEIRSRYARIFAEHAAQGERIRLMEGRDGKSRTGVGQLRAAKPTRKV
jgi:hypothetical protein